MATARFTRAKHLMVGRLESVRCSKRTFPSPRAFSFLANSGTTWTPLKPLFFLENTKKPWRTSSGCCCCAASAWTASTWPSRTSWPAAWERNTSRRLSSASRRSSSSPLRSHQSYSSSAQAPTRPVTWWNSPRGLGSAVISSSSWLWAKARRRCARVHSTIGGQRFVFPWRCWNNCELCLFCLGFLFLFLIFDFLLCSGPGSSKPD